MRRKELLEYLELKTFIIVLTPKDLYCTENDRVIRIPKTMKPWDNLRFIKIEGREDQSHDKWDLDIGDEVSSINYVKSINNHLAVCNSSSFDTNKYHLLYSRLLYSCLPKHKSLK